MDEKTFRRGARLVSHLLHPPSQTAQAERLELSILRDGPTNELSHDLAAFGFIADKELHETDGDVRILNELRTGEAKAELPNQVLVNNWRAWRELS